MELRRVHLPVALAAHHRTALQSQLDQRRAEERMAWGLLRRRTAAQWLMGQAEARIHFTTPFLRLQGKGRGNSLTFSDLVGIGSPRNKALRHPRFGGQETPHPSRVFRVNPPLFVLPASISSLVNFLVIR